MKHCIIVKWNDKVSDKEEFYLKACDAFRDVTLIDGVTGLRVLRSCSDRSNRADLVIEIECSGKGLENYDCSRLHSDWKKNFSEFFGSKMIFDYE